LLIESTRSGPAAPLNRLPRPLFRAVQGLTSYGLFVCLLQQAEAEEEAPAKHEPAAPNPKPAQWTVDELCEFFTAQELGVYIPAIRKEKVDGRMLIDLIAGGGLGELGVKSMLHELRIKRGLEDAADDHPSGAQAVVRCALWRFGVVPPLKTESRSLLSRRFFFT
jgi:hypothetical protein